MRTTDQLHVALAELEGKTPDQIAAMMVQRGIKGRPGTTKICPLAVFFNAVHTGKFVIGREFIIRISGKTSEKAKTPKVLADFVRRFDIGQYPQLIAMPPRCLAKTRPHDKGRARPSGRHPRQAVRINHFAKDVGRFA